MDEKIWKELTELAGKQLAGLPDRLTPDMLLKEDLGLDSFTIVFFLSLVEDVSGAVFEEEELFSPLRLLDVAERMEAAGKAPESREA